MYALLNQKFVAFLKTAWNLSIFWASWIYVIFSYSFFKIRCNISMEIYLTCFNLKRKIGIYLTDISCANWFALTGRPQIFWIDVQEQRNISYCILYFYFVNTQRTEKSRIILYIIKNTFWIWVLSNHKAVVLCQERSKPWGGCSNLQSRNRPVFPWSHQEERNKVLAKKRRRKEAVVGVRAKVCFRWCAKF
jgi:hypothetical protein